MSGESAERRRCNHPCIGYPGGTAAAAAAAPPLSAEDKVRGRGGLSMNRSGGGGGERGYV